MEKSVKCEALTKVSEVELIYRSKVKASERQQINSSKDAYEILIANWDENRIELLEEFKVLLLNRSNKVLGIYKVSSGGITGTVADPRLIFAAALKAVACAIVLSHSHPSGNLKPSSSDNELTAKIKEGGKFLDIQVLDHIIISKEGYYSYADDGIL